MLRTFSYEAEAIRVKSLTEHNGEVGAWTDGIGVFCDASEQYKAYSLVPGKKYRITIEVVQETHKDELP